tara:strand:+ start:516 stop:872 length:357 start_codon:yes stop_codon:yes gene_type:complete
MMKNFFISALMVILIVNTATVFALPHPCVYHMKSVSATISTDTMSECQQTKKQKQSDYKALDCESLCLCAYISSGPSAFLENGDMHPSFTLKQTFMTYVDSFVSIDQNPPKRPPKYTS